MANIFTRKKSDVDMTDGNILRHIITFAIPLLIGNLFQQLYNMVDTWVIGNYGSDAAYAAVGSVGPIINMLIGIFIGLSSGAGVVISQYYGAKKYKEVGDTVHTSIVMTLILAAAFMLIGIFMAPLMLRLMKMPESVIPDATTYLTIYFAGIAGLMIYNIGSGILRAVGDSTRPFYFLAVSALINIVLDLLFVIKFDMGVAGVALATVIAQFVSAILVLITLFRANNCVKLALRALKLNTAILLKIVKVGIPAAIQMAITAFSNVFVQSYINHFGDYFMSGWTSYAKIDQLLFLPMQSIALASTTFVGQNLGKDQPERAKAGVRLSVIVAITATVIMMIPIMVFAPEVVSFFNDTPEVVEYGALLLRMITPFYVFCCFNQIYSGALRGAGDTRAPMIMMVSSFVVFRQIYLIVATNFIANTIPVVALSYPAGWILATVLTGIYYAKTKFTSKIKLDSVGSDTPSVPQSDEGEPAAEANEAAEEASTV